MNQTRDSHVLMELAFEQGGEELQDQMAEVLFRNYFTDAKDVGEKDVLLAAVNFCSLLWKCPDCFVITLGQGNWGYWCSGSHL